MDPFSIPRPKQRLAEIYGYSYEQWVRAFEQFSAAPRLARHEVDNLFDLASCAAEGTAPFLCDLNTLLPLARAHPEFATQLLASLEDGLAETAALLSPESRAAFEGTETEWEERVRDVAGTLEQQAPLRAELRMLAGHSDT